MNKNLACQTFERVDVLADDCDQQTRAEFELHLDSCEACQQRITESAAGEGWWAKTATRLLTIDEIEIPAQIESRLSVSSSVFVPSFETDRKHNKITSLGSSQESAPDWQRILDPPSHPEMLGRIDQFEIESKIGQGGMGIVLKGFDRDLNRAVAIKVLAPHLASNGTSRKRFAREARAAAAVVHQNVVPIYAVNASDTRPYIVMQLVSGHSLQSLIEENGPLDVREIVRIAIQVADGLAEAHQQGLIHRDIKPANILIEQDVSRVMITDFGLARASDDASMTQTGWIAGTPHYMSPEQARGETLDSRSDLFSLGALMYFLGTGRVPFRSDKSFAVIQKILNEQPASPLEVNNELSPMLSDIIEKLLEKNPQDRFKSAAAVRDLLKRYLSHLHQPEKVAKPNRIITSRVLTGRKRRLRNWVITGVTASAIAAGIYFGVSSWHPESNKSVPNTSTTAAASTSASSSSEELNSAASNSTGANGVTSNDSGSSRFSLITSGTKNEPDSAWSAGFFNGETDDSLLLEIESLERETNSLSSSLLRANPLNQVPSGENFELRFSSELQRLDLKANELQQREAQQTKELNLRHEENLVREQDAIRQEEPNLIPKNPENK